MTEEFNKIIGTGTVRTIQAQFELVCKVKELEQISERAKLELKKLKHRAMLLDIKLDGKDQSK